MSSACAPGGTVSRPREAILGSVRSRDRESWLFVLAGAALLTLGVFPAYAAPSPSLSGSAETIDVGSREEIDCDPTAAELEDIEFIAEQDGIPLDEAIARYGWQSCFVELTSYLQDTYSDLYAGAAITDGGRGAWIAFKGDVPAEAAELAESMPVVVELIGGKGFSEAELNEVLQAVYFDISNHEDVVAANGGYDHETGVITIQAQPSEALTDPAQRDQLLEAQQPEQPANTAITVEVIIVDELGGADDASTSQADGLLTPAVYASLGAAAVVALLAALLIWHKRRRSAGNTHVEVAAHE